MKIDIPLNFIRMAVSDQLLDQCDHLGNKFRSLGLLGWRKAVQCFRILLEACSGLLREGGGIYAHGVCARDDFVVDIGDVADKRHRIVAI